MKKEKGTDKIEDIEKKVVHKRGKNSFWAFRKGNIKRSSE